MMSSDNKAERIVLKRSIPDAKFNIFFSIVTIILLVIFCNITHTSWLFTCSILLMFLIMLVASIYMLRDDEPRLVMDEKGIDAKGVGQFAWENIEEVWPEYYRGFCMLAVKLKDGDHVRIGISSLTMRPDDIRYYIEKQLARLKST